MSEQSERPPRGPSRAIARRTLAVGTALGATAIMVTRGARPAAAQPSKSTWEVITGTKKLRLGVAISEPFAFKDLEGSDKPGAVKAGSSVWRGVSVNCGKELADALGAEMEVVETTYGNAVIGLQTDKFDLIFALDGTVKRAVAVDFVPQPLFMYGTAILAHTGADIATWQAINDKKQAEIDKKKAAQVAEAQARLDAARQAYEQQVAKINAQSQPAPAQPPQQK